MAGRCQLGSDRLGAVPIVLWADSDPVQSALFGLQLAKKCRVALLA
jgi:hypothetical protein